MKLRVILVATILILSLSITVAVYYILRSKNNIPIEQDNILTSFPRDNLKKVINDEFNYSYGLPQGYLSRIETNDIGYKGVVYGELIYKDEPRKVDYQTPGIDLKAYDANILGNGTLEEWIKNQTSEEFTDGKKRFVSTTIKSIRNDYVYLLVDSNPILTFEPSPVLFFKTDNFVYVVAQVMIKDNYALFKNIVSSMELGGNKLSLTTTELSDINYYFE